MNSIDRVFSYFSSSLLLFLTCAGIWGSTWLVIKYQISDTDPIISVFLRFLISTLILFAFAHTTKRPMKYSKTSHLNFFFQGACNFSINYIITYLAEQYAPSAVVAMAFTLLVAYNILGMKIFYKKIVSKNVYLGTASGILGIFFVFGHELTTLSDHNSSFRGLGLGLLATVFASAGNLFSYKNHLHRIPVTIANAWGMFYGTVVTLIIAIIFNRPFHVPWSSTYWLSLLYLSLFGTVIAFGAYLTLVGRIGAERAGYTSILSPVIAIILSALFEDFKISIYIALGLLFCLLGVFLTLRHPTRSSTEILNTKS
jgi:drug/metabolite transporter (DMT)-like permease